MRDKNFVLVCGKTLEEIHKLLDLGCFVVAYAGKCQICDLNGDEKFKDAYLILPGIEDCEIAEQKLTKIKEFLLQKEEWLQKPKIFLSKSGDASVTKLTFTDVSDLDALKERIAAAWTCTSAEGVCILQEVVEYHERLIEVTFIVQNNRLGKADVELIKDIFGEAADVKDAITENCFFE